MLAPDANQVGEAGEAGDGDELGPGETDDAGGKAGEDEAFALQPKQHQQQEEDPEGGRVGVRQDEVEGCAGEADRGDDCSRDRARHHAQQLPCESVEGGDDCRGLQQAEGEGGGEAGAEDGEGTAQGVEADRAVGVADVAVGVPTGGKRAGDVELVTGIDRGHTPGAPAEGGEQAEEQQQAGDRAGVGVGGQATRLGAETIGPAFARRLGANRDVHADAGRTAPSSSRTCSFIAIICSCNRARLEFDH